MGGGLGEIASATFAQRGLTIAEADKRSNEARFARNLLYSLAA